MPGPETEPRYRPSPKAVEILCERLQQMGVSISESAARRLLETVLAIEGPRLDSQAHHTLQASIESIRRAAEDALNTLRGKPVEPPRRDYELSFPPAPEPPLTVSGQRRKVASSRPVPRPNPPRERENLRPDDSGEEPRPVFKRRRGR
jgi:type IV secretory pathway VirB10-like protein